MIETTEIAYLYLIAARRLLLADKRISALRRGNMAEAKELEKTMKETDGYLEKEVRKLGSYTPPNKSGESRINLSELTRHLKDVNQALFGQPIQTQGATDTTKNASQTTFKASYYKEEVDIEISYSELPYVEGLVLRDKHLAETDRYRLEFLDGSSFKVTDKWSGQSTVIWGDPHVDTSDQTGNYNGEFSDLDGSDSHTTLMLQDGTRVTFTAKDNGLIERVDIFKSGQHLSALAAGTQGLKTEDYFFTKPVDNASVYNNVPTGDTVYAGGDGNDWYTGTGQLVWGALTGPVISSRPAFAMTINYHRRVVEIEIEGQVNNPA